jgi:chemotaxis protein CheX
MSAFAHAPGGKNVPPFDAWRLLLQEAVKEVFSMMVGTEISVPAQANPPVITEVTGMVGLAGELCGLFCVRCSKSCASKIASKMLDVPETEAASHMSDAVGEICNMMAGNFKAKIDGLQDKCMLSVPTIIIGGDYEVFSPAVGNRIELPFLFETESVWVGLEVRT